MYLLLSYQVITLSMQTLDIQKSCSFPQCRKHLSCRCQNCQQEHRWYPPMPHGPCCWEGQCSLQVPALYEDEKTVSFIVAHTNCFVLFAHIETLLHFILQPGRHPVNDVVLLIWVTVDIVQLKWSWDREGCASTTILH